MDTVLHELQQLAEVVVSGVIAAIVGIYVPKAIAAFQTWSNVKLTDQQVAQLTAAAKTGAGNLETMIDQGIMSVGDIKPTHPVVQAQAQAAIDRVPAAAAAQNKTVPSMAATIVGMVDTSKYVAPPVPEVHAPPPPATASISNPGTAT